MKSRCKQVGNERLKRTACSCLHGVCNNGPDGDGLCKKNTCDAGYISENCDRKLVACGARTVTCHAHSFCYVGDDNIYRCKCNPGYEGDGQDCVEMDPCEQKVNGGCHQQAECIKLTPLTLRCECIEGWTGDGEFCSPRSPCYRGCHENATCLDVNLEYHCVCNAGYSGNGTWCETDNVCLENNGGCDPKIGLNSVSLSPQSICDQTPNHVLSIFCEAPAPASSSDPRMLDLAMVFI
ncbi:stabilin-2 [Elysia marginata]|uniref:Stabilin-2 n=1 Tax=Elysia marginata TaxID=1093978 RepID=A0AAV4FW07_9GAST|nr:stabilin-2 [Elysia marginata]